MEKDQGLTDDQKMVLRVAIVAKAVDCLDIPYYLGAEWTDYSKLPAALDCSELVEGCYLINGLKCPDGAQNQFNAFLPIPADQAKIGDLVFFGKGGDAAKIYHVGIVYSNESIIEARGHQPESSFETGKVILRPRLVWEHYPNFAGYRCHTKLM